ncbi:uncharacterized protein PHACADRAFT_207575 [Phanerochaete carnosa HHB-10118-sp]|uniref:DUF6533 domain-containing protein n=1 Tax=Phanerochaete carnosa (strain HHB-10118-sp) TaxID=650164 RepID=K5WAT7_PHACS|nr:uncharacterized protein PHACADRAFT_207575 [Phanerochaete carnosa HHB-10118-sp]EKM56295.1 hypothetical protein PHACADRAFT_207575 [Phanerochaete carnosa HHB-10118-sp]
MLSLVVYEYLTTLHQEISVVWGGKFTITSTLLLATRGTMLLGPLLEVVPSEQAWCTLYFLVLLAINILDLLTFSDSNFYTGTYANIFIKYMPPLLVQRFILNLRQLNRTAGEDNSDAQQFSRLSISFRMSSGFLGNIGELLEYGQSEQVEDNGGNDSCMAEEPRGGFEEGSVHQEGPSLAYRDEPTEPEAAPVLRLAEHASKEGIVESPAYSRGMVAGPSTAAR